MFLRTHHKQYGRPQMLATQNFRDGENHSKITEWISVMRISYRVTKDPASHSVAGSQAQTLSV